MKSYPQRLAQDLFLLLEFIHLRPKPTPHCHLQSPTLCKLWSLALVSSLIPSFPIAQKFSKISSLFIGSFFIPQHHHYMCLCVHVCPSRVDLIPPSRPVHLCRDLKWGRHVPSGYQLDPTSQWLIKMKNQS